MRRYAYPRWVVVVALTCQVLSALFVHVPSASGAVTAPATEAAHCPDHASMATATDGIDNAAPAAAVVPTGVAPSGHSVATAVTSADAASETHDPAAPEHSCKAGHCTCPCAHPPVAASDTDRPAPTTPHLPVMRVYVAAPLTELSTPFFRPPI